jgi:hypothetical protein
MKEPVRVTRKLAESLAIQALTFIAADPERLGRFLALTGIGPGDIRNAARAPHFLAGVLDHLAGDEQLLVAFAGDAQIDPNLVAAARTVLARQSREHEAP